jgi:5-methylcytosine-specific restriction endonuclease McrA
MKLTNLKPRLQAVAPRLATLTARTGDIAQRKTGYAGVMERKRIRERDCGMCQNCGRNGRDVDHDIPLWAGIAVGGTNEDGNMRVLCFDCHEEKTALEAAQRASRSYNRNAVLRLMRELERQRRLVPR